MQVGSAGINSEAANNMIQNFWDSAMALSPEDDDENRRSVFAIELEFKFYDHKLLSLLNFVSFLNVFQCGFFEDAV